MFHVEKAELNIEASGVISQTSSSLKDKSVHRMAMTLSLLYLTLGSTILACIQALLYSSVVIFLAFFTHGGSLLQYAKECLY